MKDLTVSNQGETGGRPLDNQPETKVKPVQKCRICASKEAVKRGLKYRAHGLCWSCYKEDLVLRKRIARKAVFARRKLENAELKQKEKKVFEKFVDEIL